MNGNISRNFNNLSSHYGNTSAIQVLPNLTTSSPSKQPLIDISKTNNINSSHSSGEVKSAAIIDGGIREVLASLALMCVLSLLMAFLALFFLQKTCPIVSLTHNSNSNSETNDKLSKNVNFKPLTNTKDYMRIFQISVSLSTLTITLDLCCLFVCCIQFLSAVKLLKTPFGNNRAYKFLKKSSLTRIAAIGAFLISIPIFFTGVILFVFVNFDEVPALITSVIIGIGIVFCGIASIQNVYLWQWEKTKASQKISDTQLKRIKDFGYLPNLELSTLV